ncbi:hypothetical protein IX51_11685 [uncultured archaeon]|nr:hypothetical protein IX51_11685 [uncultured archaeon]HKJ96690.1 class I SAM-dependent methyltransferase [Thermoplasmataceae archaeon]
MVEKEVHVRGVFEAIQDKYDLLDSIISFGMDQPWRKKVLMLMGLQPGMTVLDSGAGTGKLTKMIRNSCGNCKVISLDITEKMFRPSLLSGVEFVVGSAEDMPIESSSVDRAASCFLTRNLSSVDSYLDQLNRVLKPGGIFVNLDIYPPENPVFSRLFGFYFYRIVPRIGDRATNSDSYSYLADSVRNFISPEQMGAKIRNHGFELVEQKVMALGTVAIHAGKKVQ